MGQVEGTVDNQEATQESVETENGDREIRAAFGRGENFASSPQNFSTRFGHDATRKTLRVCCKRVNTVENVILILNEILRDKLLKFYEIEDKIIIKGVCTFK